MNPSDRAIWEAVAARYQGMERGREEKVKGLGKEAGGELAGMLYSGEGRARVAPLLERMAAAHKKNVLVSNETARMQALTEIGRLMMGRGLMDLEGGRKLVIDWESGKGGKFTKKEREDFIAGTELVLKKLAYARLFNETDYNNQTAPRPSDVYGERVGTIVRDGKDEGAFKLAFSDEWTVVKGRAEKPRDMKDEAWWVNWKA